MSDKVTVNVRMPPDLVRDIDDKADELNMNRSSLIRLVLTRAVQNGDDRLLS